MIERAFPLGPLYRGSVNHLWPCLNLFPTHQLMNSLVAVSCFLSRRLAIISNFPKSFSQPLNNVLTCARALQHSSTVPPQHKSTVQAAILIQGHPHGTRVLLAKTCRLHARTLMAIKFGFNSETRETCPTQPLDYTQTHVQ